MSAQTLEQWLVEQIEATKIMRESAAHVAKLTGRIEAYEATLTHVRSTGNGRLFEDEG